jgi:outer membrane lipoprotein-sorting protein
MRRYILGLLFAAFCATAFAQPAGFSPITDEAGFKKKFAEASASLKTIKCDFVQEKNINVLSEKIISKGHFSFKKENKVRMEYDQPYKYLLVINKNDILIRNDQKTNTFSAKSNAMFERINKIIIDCVQGTAMDNKDFSTKCLQSKTEYLLVLTPLKKNLKEMFSTISIYIEKNDYSINKMDMLDQSGDNTVISFLKKEFNVTIPDEVFFVK